MRTIRSLLVLLCAATLSAACEETAVQDITAPLPENTARIKFFNFGVGAPGVNFYANDQKMTAISSTTGSESTAGVNFGGVGAGGLYIAIDPGQYNLSGRIAATTDKDLAITTTPATLEQGKAYSFYVSGIYNTTTKTADSFVVEDPFIANFDYSTAYVRFVHAISNANPMTMTVRERTDSTTVVLGGEIPYKSATPFVKVPPGSYDLFTRYAGASTNAITRTAVGFAAGRVYTITARGNITTASTVLLDNTLNR